MNPLQQQKELLIAESELNRAQLREDWCAMTAGVHTLTTRMKSIGTLASAAALVVSAISGYRRERAASAAASWIDTALKAVKVAGSVWLAFRSPGRKPGDE